jgi:hypothetical protein
MTDYKGYDIDRLSESINNKADRDLENITLNVDYVVEWKAPTSADPTWYRLYKSGWCEQGGLDMRHGYFVINFLKEMADKNYQVQLTESYNNTSGVDNSRNDNMMLLNTSTTVSSMYVYINDTANIGVWWEVKGMAKVS